MIASTRAPSMRRFTISADVPTPRRRTNCEHERERALREVLRVHARQAAKITQHGCCPLQISVHAAMVHGERQRFTGAPLPRKIASATPPERWMTACASINGRKRGAMHEMSHSAE